MSRRFLRIILSVFLAVSGFAQLGLAQGHGQGHGKGQGRGNQSARQDDRDSASADSNRNGSVIFSSRDRRIISDYFRGNTSNLPPGLAKRGGNLPPGLQRQLARNGTLPPGLQKRLTPLPADLERRLPRLPDIYRRGSVGDSVVIIDRRTQRIMDVIDAVTRP